MNYHDITHDDLKNGDGVRVVLWVAGCEHHCQACQNPVTWDPNDGLLFDMKAAMEIYHELSKDYVSGLTFSGGDPLHPSNRRDVLLLAQTVKAWFPMKTVWLYTGYLWEQVQDKPDISEILQYIDVLVDGRFDNELKDVSYPWAGSTNQRVIDVQKSITEGRVIIHESR